MPVVAKREGQRVLLDLIIAQFFLDFNGVTKTKIQFYASSPSSYLPNEIR